MTLIRRIVSVFLLVLIVAGAVYGLIWLRNKNLKILDPLRALPEGVVVFAETNDFQQLTSSVVNFSNIWPAFKAYPTVRRLDRHIRLLDSLGRRNMGESNAGRDMIFSLNRVDSTFSILCILETRNAKATEQILKLIPPDAEINKRREGKVMIYEVENSHDTLFPAFSFYETSGLLVLSPSSSLLEASAAHLFSGESIAGNPEFARLKGTTGSDVVSNVYIHYGELGNFFKTILNDHVSEPVAGFAGWSALDLDMAPDYFTLNGFTSAGDSLHQTIRMFHGQEPVPFDMTGTIPSSAVWFSLTGFSDASLLERNVEKYATDSLRDDRLGKVRKRFGIDPANEFAEVLDREAGSVTTMSKPGEYERFFLVGLKGKGMGQKIMEKWTSLVAAQKNLPGSDFTMEVSIDHQHQVTIHRSPFKGLPGMLFGSLYDRSDYDYYTYVGNDLVFGTSPSSLRSFVYSNILGKTLDNDENFNALKNHISSRSNLFVYLNPSLYLEGLTRLMVPAVADAVERQRDIWRRIDAVAFQSTSTDDLSYFRVFTHYTKQVREQVNTVWESKLDTISLFKPAIVVNHTNGQKEIFTQDLSHHIYLLSNTGSVLWKQQTDGDILSDIFQIDYYGNGKLQYLFNTKSEIYLIDRNGNPVERYPVELREPASAGLSLFDYDHDGTLRICIPSQNKGIYMFDREGKIVPGWRFGGSDYPVQHPPYHVRVGDKDYIIASDAVRLYILDRRGNTRVRPARNIMFSERNPVFPVVSSAAGRSHIVATDTSGTVWYFYFDGRVAKVFETGLSSKHYFVPADLDGKGSEEFIFVDGNKLLAYDEQGRLLFNESWPRSISWPPIIYEFSAKDKKIGIVTRESGRIYLVNNDGSIYQGFPLVGISPFSISAFPGLKDRFNLIVGNNDNFLYNYSVK